MDSRTKHQMPIAHAPTQGKGPDESHCIWQEDNLGVPILIGGSILVQLASKDGENGGTIHTLQMVDCFSKA